MKIQLNDFNYKGVHYDKFTCECELEKDASDADIVREVIDVLEDLLKQHDEKERTS